MVNIRSFATKNRNIPTIIVCLLLSLVGFLTKKGIAHDVAFALVFTVFDFLVLAFIKKGLVKTYGNARAINIFVYGLGLISLLIFILLLFRN